MSKQVIKGWVEKGRKAKDFVNRGRYATEFQRRLVGVVENTKGKKSDWDPYDWPPKRVTITIEVDE